jgi:hypothetical protein
VVRAFAKTFGYRVRFAQESFEEIA